VLWRVVEGAYVRAMLPRLYAMRADAAEALPANDRALTASAR
jgi:hypothetical protein